MTHAEPGDVARRAIELGQVVRVCRGVHRHDWHRHRLSGAPYPGRRLHDEQCSPDSLGDRALRHLQPDAVSLRAASGRDQRPLREAPGLASPRSWASASTTSSSRWRHRSGSCSSPAFWAGSRARASRSRTLISPTSRRPRSAQKVSGLSAPLSVSDSSLGPPLGGLLGDIDLHLPFYVAAALSLLNALYGFSSSRNRFHRSGAESSRSPRPTRSARSSCSSKITRSAASSSCSRFLRSDIWR